MPKRIPILAAKNLAKRYDLRQVILLGWDGDKTHVVTYGKSLEDCDMAAAGGNKLKKSFGWPEDLMAYPSRVRRIQDELEVAKKRITELEAEAQKSSEGRSGT